MIAMKKNILFIMNNLNCGGAEKALISLLETLDYSKFNVDLFLFKHEGIFFPNIPKQVNLLEEPFEYKYFDMPIKTAVKESMNKRDFNLVLARIRAGLIFKTEKNKARCEQRVWKYLSNTLNPNIDKKYDVAIGYLEKNPIYFCIEKVDAKKKLGFIHNDYEKLGMDSTYDQKYFNKLDHIITVSKECATVLKKLFPFNDKKIEVMHNIVSPRVIKKMSLERVNVPNDKVNLLSIGRLDNQKGFDLAINACNQLIENGLRIKWYVIGEGGERAALESLIRENNLQDHFILLGIKENPYPFIKAADVYVQPSRFEGKSIAIDEAKILHKPIVVTNFSTVKDQIQHNENGIIVDMQSEALAEGIKRLVLDEKLRCQLKSNLSKEKLGSESEILKLYKLFNVG